MKIRILAAALAAGLVSACGGEGNENQARPANAAAANGEAGSRSIGEALANSPGHSRFMAAVEQAGLTETLRGAGPYTLFAPADPAFEGAELPGEGEALVGLIAGHISPGAVTREDLVNAARRNEAGRAELTTLGGGTISVSLEDGQVVLTDGAGAQARIVEADGIHSNGVVHKVDAVLRPSGE